MSSIAYITDPNIIEYHRIHGSDAMVFWRSGIKKFLRFDVGDLVFFIDKRHRHPMTLEKGIIGMGTCSALRNTSVKKAWDNYNHALGYETIDVFKEAIRSFRKEDDKLPARIQCIELENLVFFQYPVYLSEVSFDLSERLESFTYLEKEETNLTVDILRIAQSLGTDVWYEMQRVTPVKSFEAYIDEQKVREALLELPRLNTTKTINILKRYTSSVYLESVAYSINESTVTLNYVYTGDKNLPYLIYGVQEYAKTLLPLWNVTAVIYAKNLSSDVIQLCQALNLEHVSI